MSKYSQFLVVLSVAVIGHFGADHAAAQSDLADTVRSALSFATDDGAVRVQLSGYTDIEAYSLPETSPGLIFTDERTLWNPRLTLFLDGQIGSQWYFFAQGRLDRGFDPSEYDAETRLDGSALRFTPWEDGRLILQAGQFATVVGARTERHLSWDNPFINAPLAYENLTGIWDDAAASSSGTLLAWGHVPTAWQSDFGNGFYDKHLRVPVIWGPSYATGVSAAGHLGKFEYTVETKNAGLASAPESWDASEGSFEHPAFSGRLGYRPDPRWNFGVSASSAPYLVPEAAASLPAGSDIDDYKQNLVGADASFEWHHLQIWSEIFLSRFEVPTVGDADTLAYHIEAKYKITPQLYGALRWNQQLFSDITHDGKDVPWGRDIWRIDSAVGYRFTPNTQLKLQYGIQNEAFSNEEFEHTVAAQFTVKF